MSKEKRFDLDVEGLVAAQSKRPLTPRPTTEQKSAIRTACSWAPVSDQKPAPTCKALAALRGVVLREVLMTTPVDDVAISSAKMLALITAVALAQNLPLPPMP